MGALDLDRDALNAFLAAVDRHFPLRRAVLFGSRARGEPLVDSDVDLILVSPAFAGMRPAERMQAVAEHWCLAVPLEVLCFTPEEFAHKVEGLTLVREAVATGIELWPPPGGER